MVGGGFDGLTAASLGRAGFPSQYSRSVTAGSKRWASVMLIVAACSNPSKPPPAAPRLTSPAGETAPGYTGDGAKVVIIGDSLTVLGWKRLYDDLTAHYAVRIGALGGEGYAGNAFRSGLRSRPFVLVDAEQFAKSHPAIAVLAVGTNDAWNARNIEKALGTMHAMVSDLAPACMVGVTVPAQSSAQGWSPRVARALNAAMRTWAKVVVDWASLSRKPGTLLPDDVHTTAAGTVLRADAIAAAVKRCQS
jgi:lysophospholipase L1-like esterase